MKKVLFCLCLILSVQGAWAKKVKFAVNMSGQTLSPNGIHVTGDFQTIAGYPGGDWAAGTTTMVQDPVDTNIYSVVVDIPAFAKYEYKFVNGDQFYEAEFVPVESRVGYNFNDNRWIYVDSIANDTTFVGAILFAGNAPMGMTLLRFLVDMQSQSSVNANGVHVAGSFQNWDPAATILYSFGGTVYEIISYVNTGTYAYKFYNGNSGSDAETVPAGCNVNGDREVVVNFDTVFAAPVCFASCTSCSTTSLVDHSIQSTVTVYPNPVQQVLTIHPAEGMNNYDLQLFDQVGRTCYSETGLTGDISLARNQIPSGLYYVQLTDTQTRQSSIAKVIFQ